MDINNRPGKLQLPVYLLALVGAGLLIYGGISSIFNSGVPTVSAQTDLFLERRVSQLEQRFNFFETRISRLEQNSRFPTTVPGAGVDTETRALRSEVEILRLRIAELECAAARLDERTLTEAARRARRQAGARETDPCRLSPDAALKLSARP